MTTQAAIEAITTYSYTDYAPVNDVDPSKVDALAAAMELLGWSGAPIVVDGDSAITGSHRLAARAQAELETIPVVEISAICEVCEIDWLEMLEVNSFDLRLAAIEVGSLLPSAVVEYLGYDAE